LRDELFRDDDLGSLPELESICPFARWGCWPADLGMFSICSISPGPVVLAGLMDPDTYTVAPEVTKLNREQQLPVRPLPHVPHRSVFTISFLAPRGNFQPSSFSSPPSRSERRLEIEGDTADIQSHFHNCHTNGSSHACFGWGHSPSPGAPPTPMLRSFELRSYRHGCKITIRSLKSLAGFADGPGVAEVAPGQLVNGWPLSV